MGLFKPAWMSDNRDKALKAVRKETNQSKLLETAKNARDFLVLRAAVEKLTDQNLLADLAKNAADNGVRIWAADKLTDQILAQQIYADVAKNADYYGTRQEAVEKLTDQSVLADVAKNDLGDDVRLEAVKKLTDQVALADVAKNDTYSIVRREAAEKLTNQAVLADVAKNDTDEYVRRGAIEKLTDQAVLADVAKNDLKGYVRLTAVKNLTDQSVLADVAKNAADNDVRLAAAEKLTDQALAQEVYADLARRSADYGVRRTAEKKLTGKSPNDDVIALPKLPPLGTLVSSASLPETGKGLNNFNKAIQAGNDRNYSDSINYFDKAIRAGLDHLREGYAYAMMGERKLLEFYDVEKAAADFIKALSYNEVLCETVHTASQYLYIFYKSAGAFAEASQLEALYSQTSSYLNYSLDPNVAQRVRKIAGEVHWIYGRDFQEQGLKERERIEQIRLAQKQEIDCLADELIKIGKAEGFVSEKPGGVFDDSMRHIRAREIGEKLNQIGGIELMQDVGGGVSSALRDILGRESELKSIWIGIGQWK